MSWTLRCRRRTFGDAQQEGRQAAADLLLGAGQVLAQFAGVLGLPGASTVASQSRRRGPDELISRHLAGCGAGGSVQPPAAAPYP